MAIRHYAGRTEELKKSTNLFVVVVLAHLAACQTGRKEKRHSRRREKLEIVKHLYRKGFSRQDVISMFRFIDWVMELPEKEENLFREELSSVEKEEKMPYVTSVERIGFRRGVLGREAGRNHRAGKSSDQTDSPEIPIHHNKGILSTGIWHYGVCCSMSFFHSISLPDQSGKNCNTHLSMSADRKVFRRPVSERFPECRNCISAWLTGRKTLCFIRIPHGKNIISALLRKIFDLLNVANRLIPDFHPGGMWHFSVRHQPI